MDKTEGIEKNKVHISKDTIVTSTAKQEEIPCKKGQSNNRMRAIAATSAEYFESNHGKTSKKVGFLPRIRSASAVDLTQLNEGDVTNNGPCNPDLERCCQNISAFLAAAAAKSKTNGKFRIPTAGFIYGYMRILFKVLQLEPECCVYAYIYIRRLQCGTGIRIRPGNWQKILVGTCLLATKFVDDISMQNSQFAFALNHWSLQRVNRCESAVLDALKWKIYVPISEYTVQYFKLERQPAMGCDWHVDVESIVRYFNIRSTKYGVKAPEENTCTLEMPTLLPTLQCK